MFYRILITTITAVSTLLQLHANQNIEAKYNPVQLHKFTLAQLTDGINLEDHIQIVVDTFCELSHKDILNHEGKIDLNSFVFDSKFKRGKYGYWLEFYTQNNSKKSIELSFYCGKFDSLTIYKNLQLVDEFGKMVKAENNSKDEPTLINATQLHEYEHSKNHYLVYIRNAPGIPRTISPIIQTESALANQLYFKSKDHWLILYLEFGALLIMWIYFLIQFVLKRNYVRFYYLAYLTSISLFMSRSVFMGHPYIQLFNPIFNDYFFYSLLSSSTFIAYLLFLKAIIQELSIQSKRLNLFIKSLLYLSIALLVTDRILLAIDYHLAWKVSIAVHSLIMIFYILVGTLILLQKNQVLKMIGVGSLLLNTYFLFTSLLKLKYSFSETLFGHWFYPVTCFIILIELLLFIIAMKRLDVISVNESSNTIARLNKEQENLRTLLSNEKTKSNTGTDSKFLLKINSIIEQNLANEQMNATFLYRRLSTNHVSLNKKLKALTGFSTHQYIIDIKLRHAKNLLVRTELTISEIAFQVGIKDPTYFSKLFRKKFNRSPRQFRNELKTNIIFQ